MDVTHESLKQVGGMSVFTETAGQIEQGAGYFERTFLVRGKQTVNRIKPKRKNKDKTAGS